METMLPTNIEPSVARFCGPSCSARRIGFPFTDKRSMCFLLSEIGQNSLIKTETQETNMGKVKQGWYFLPNAIAFAICLSCL